MVNINVNDRIILNDMYYVRLKSYHLDLDKEYVINKIEYDGNHDEVYFIYNDIKTEIGIKRKHFKKSITSLRNDVIDDILL